MKANDASMIFDFISEGPKGFIKKRVQYTLTHQTNVFNLAFGDVIDETNDFDDVIVSDNKDSKKVLATVASTVSIFMRCVNLSARLILK